jgi:PAS domain S-box-containing protein
MAMSHCPDENLVISQNIPVDPLAEPVCKSIERYRNLIQGIAQIVWEVDADGETSQDISQWSDFTGQTRQQMQHHGWLDAIHPEDRDRANQAWQTAVDLAASSPPDRHVMFQIEYRLRHHQGDYRWMEVHGVPVFTTEGTVQKWMGFHQDIDERKQAQFAVQVQAAEICQLDRLLTQMMALVDRRDRELDQFTYTISHDLKAPLRAVTNLAQWIEDDLMGEIAVESGRQLQLLRTRVGRMEALIDGLLAYSRIGRMEVHTEPVVVVELVAEIVDLLAPPESFTIDIDTDLPTFDTKRWSLGQVFSNLIDNAIKHHDRDDGNIHITGQTLADSYEFTVTDDGPGIPFDRHEFVFGIFHTLGQKVESTGIGLAIVKKIVEAQGGKIELSSDLGLGTSLRFTWSLSSEPSPQWSG